MASNTLEGFHEVNLASPASPDHTELSQSETNEAAASGILYHPHSLVSSSPVQPCTLITADLPTQPIYPSSQNLSSGESRNVRYIYLLCLIASFSYTPKLFLISRIIIHARCINYV